MATASHDNDRRFWAQLVLLRAGFTIVVVVLAILADRAYYNDQRQKLTRELSQDVAALSAQLDAVIFKNIQAVWGLRAIIATQPDIGEAHFSRLADEILLAAPLLKNIGAAPDLILSLMYPVVGNEAAIGLDFRDLADQWPDVKKAVETGEMVFSGPIELVQGGQALAGRIPVTINDDQLWGVISAIISLDTLWQAVDIEAFPHRLRIYRENDGHVFFDNGHEQVSQLISSTVHIPGNYWVLDVAPQEGWPSYLSHAPIMRILIALAALTLVAGLWKVTWLLKRDRQTQRRMQSLFELSPVGMALRKKGTQEFLQVNPALCQWLGFSEAFLQRHPQGVRILDKADTCDGADRDTLSTYGPREGKLRTKDGVYIDVLVSGLLINSDDKGVLEWLIIRNLAEEKRVARLKDEFVSTISHELRTPLTSLSASLDFLKSADLSDKKVPVDRLLQIAFSSTERLSLLIQNLLDVKELVQHEHCFELDVQPLGPILDHMVQKFSVYAAQKNVTLQLGPIDSGMKVNVEARMLKQALGNLIDNAVRFSPANGAVTINARPQPNGNVHIVVQDNGPGVDPDYKPYLFQSFSQADASNTRPQGGAGIGLLIVREIAEQMDGEVGYDDAEGGGAIFWIHLPLASDSSNDNNNVRSEQII